MTYIVLYDYLKNDQWFYNQQFKTIINNKGRHHQAQQRALRFIRNELRPSDYRIFKVECD